MLKYHINYLSECGFFLNGIDEKLVFEHRLIIYRVCLGFCLFLF